MACRVIAIALCLIALAIQCWAISYSTRSFTQQIDHFGFYQNGVYEQRYLVNDSFWVLNGPIFFYTGNEAAIEVFASINGQQVEWAIEMNALVVFAEHRYFGSSLPFGNESLSSGANLQYFTSEQALADYAELLQFLIAQYNASRSPVVAFGSSYGGMLTSWFRQKYPYLVHAAWSSAAPLRWPGNESLSYAVAAGITRSFTNCSSSIRNSWVEIFAAFQSTTSLADLSQLFQVCTPLKQSDFPNFFQWLLQGYWWISQFNYPIPLQAFNVNFPAWPANMSCTFFRSDVSTLGSVKETMNLAYNWTGNLHCYDISDTRSQMDTPFGYQLCTEIVPVIGFNGQTDMFFQAPFNLTSFALGCAAMWYGAQPRPNWLATNFGGGILTPDSATRIVYTVGSLDPYSQVCLQESISSELPLVWVPLAAHAYETFPSNPADPVSITEARITVKKYITQWISKAAAELAVKSK